MDNRLERFEAAAEALRSTPPRGAMAREAANLRRLATVASTRLAGSALDAAEATALVDRGIAAGGHPLRDYLLVRDYAQAARFAAERSIRQPSDLRPLFTIDDVRRLHMLAARSETALPGAWRAENVAPRPGGIVVVPPWMIPREMEGLVDRFGRGAIADLPVTLHAARLAGRFARIAPFACANGRVLRLLLDALFARRGIPPLVYSGTLGRGYAERLRTAAAGDPRPLADAFTRTALAEIESLLAAGDAETLIPLARAGEGAERARLYKAAQRGRLRSVERGGRRYTTQGWLDAYRRSRSRAGRPVRE